MTRNSVKVKQALLREWINQVGRKAAERLAEIIYRYYAVAEPRWDLLDEVCDTYRDGRKGLVEMTLDELTAEIAKQWVNRYEARTVKGLLNALCVTTAELCANDELKAQILR